MSFMSFFRKFLGSLGTVGELPEPMWRPVPGNPNAIEVNLAADPKRPFAGAEIAWRWGRQQGWVLVERREDGELYVDGRKVVLHFEREQTGCGLRGHQLHARLAKMEGRVLHPNIKTALMANKQLFPESWKTTEQGYTLFIHFWGVGFKDHPYTWKVECVYCHDGEVREGTRSNAEMFLGPFASALAS